MNVSKNRRTWTASQKLKIVPDSLQSDQKRAERCRREGLSPAQLYQWRKPLMKSGEAVFVRKDGGRGEDPRLVRLSAENTRLKNVIAEITSENLTLKKRSRTERSRAASRGVEARSD